MQSEVLSFVSLLMEKYVWFAVSAIKDNRFIEQHAKTFFISLFAVSNKSFFSMLLSEESIIGLSIFVAYCRSFTKIRESIDSCGRLDLILSKKVFSSP